MRQTKPDSGAGPVPIDVVVSVSTAAASMMRRRAPSLDAAALAWEDLRQEAAIGALTCPPHVWAEHGSGGVYLYARTAVIDYMRRITHGRRNRPRTGREVTCAPWDLPERGDGGEEAARGGAAVDHDRARRRLRLALERLPPHEHAALMSAAEHGAGARLARERGVTPARVSQWRRSGADLLRPLLLPHKEMLTFYHD